MRIGYWAVVLGLGLVLLVAAGPAAAQDNYEIQVYGSDTIPAHHTMVELHSNFTINGSKTASDGMYPTEHAWHETLEITRGINSWFEVGLYTFTSARSGQGWQWVGEHIRPRVRIPEKWHWPVGLIRISHQFTMTAQGQRPERPSFRGDSTGIASQSQHALGTHCMV